MGERVLRAEWAVWQRRAGVELDARAAVAAVEVVLVAAAPCEELWGQVLVQDPPVGGQRRFFEGGTSREPRVRWPPARRRRAWRVTGAGGGVTVVWGDWQREPGDP